MQTRNKSIAKLAIALTILASAITGCLTTQNSMPTASQLAQSADSETSADRAALHRGRSLAITACTDCHRTYFPQEFHANRWVYLVNDMGERAKLRPDQIRDLRRYMVAASSLSGTDPGEEVDPSAGSV